MHPDKDRNKIFDIEILKKVFRDNGAIPLTQIIRSEKLINF